MYIKKLLEDTVRKLAWNDIVVDWEMMKDKITGEDLGSKIAYTCYIEKI